MSFLLLPMLIIILIVAFKFVQVITLFSQADQLAGNPHKQYTAMVQNQKGELAARQLVRVILVGLIICGSILMYGVIQ